MKSKKPKNNKFFNLGLYQLNCLGWLICVQYVCLKLINERSIGQKKSTSVIILFSLLVQYCIVNMVNKNDLEDLKKCLTADFASKLEEAVKRLETELAKKDDTITALTNRIAELEKLKISSGNTKLAFNEIAAALAKPGSPINAAAICAVSVNSRTSENKAKNAIFLGIQPAEGDQLARDAADRKKVTEIVDFLKVSAKVISVRRVTTNENKRASQTASSASILPSIPSPVVVEFDNEKMRNSVIASAKILVTSKFSHVYIRPDRTIAEQVTFNRLYKERKEANSGLEKHGNLDKPFRFVVRGDTVRCVDVSKTLNINGFTRNSFVNDETARKARFEPYVQQ